MSVLFFQSWFFKELEPEICKDADKFSVLYYEAFDARRSVSECRSGYKRDIFIASLFQFINKFYTDAATLVWNGNPVQGSNDIGIFLSALPDSNFTIRSLDAQPIAGEISGWKLAWDLQLLFFQTNSQEAAKQCFFVPAEQFASVRESTVLPKHSCWQRKRANGL